MTNTIISVIDMQLNEIALKRVQCARDNIKHLKVNSIESDSFIALSDCLTELTKSERILKAILNIE